MNAASNAANTTAAAANTTAADTTSDIADKLESISKNFATALGTNAAALQALADATTAVSTKSDPDAIKRSEAPAPTIGTLDPVEWSTFSNQFRRVAKLNKWKDAVAVPRLLTCITDKLARATEHLAFPDPCTLEEGLRLIEKVVCSPAAIEAWEVKFKTSMRDHQESVNLWGIRVREAFRRAYPDMSADDVDHSRVLKDQFVLHLRDLSLTMTLKNEQDYRTKSFTDLCARAMDLESTAQLCRQANRPGGIHALGQYQGQYQGPQTAPPGGQEGSPNWKGIICYYCNEKGHISRNCPKKKEQQRNRAVTNGGNTGNPPNKPAWQQGGQMWNINRGRGRGWNVRRGRGGPPPNRGRGGYAKGQNGVFALSTDQADDERDPAEEEPKLDQYDEEGQLTGN